MGGGSESKKQLGKIMLQQRVVSPEALQELLEEQRREPGSRLGSVATRRGRVSVADALRALAEQHGTGMVDLSERVIPLSLLRLVPVEMARERLLMPFAVEDDRVSMAMVSPEDSELLEELSFVVGKTIIPHVCLHHMVQRTIEHAYDQLTRGEEYFVGAHVTESQLGTLGLPDLPRAPDPMAEPEGALATESAVRVPMPSAPPELDTAFSQRAHPSQIPAMPAPDPGAKVLLACSQAQLRERLRGAITELGASVVEARDGAHALALLREQLPRTLVLEADVERVHGFELCNRLRGNPTFAQLPIVMITEGARDWRVRQDLLELFGVEHCFTRSSDPHALARIVRLLIEGQPAPAELPPLSAAAEAVWNGAMEAFRGGNLDAAISQLEQGVTSEPGAFELHYHLGLLYGRKESGFAAIRALERAVALQPRHFSALKNLAVVYQRAGLRNTCIDVWQQAMSAAPDDETRATIRDHVLSLL